MFAIHRKIIRSIPSGSLVTMYLRLARMIIDMRAMVIPLIAVFISSTGIPSNSMRMSFARPVDFPGWCSIISFSSIIV